MIVYLDVIVCELHDFIEEKVDDINEFEIVAVTDCFFVKL